MGVEELILDLAKKEGKAEGRAEGKEEGKAELSLKVVRKLIIKLALSNKKAADLAGVSVAFVQQVRASIVDTLDSITDIPLNGNNKDKAKASQNDADVITYFKEMNNLPAEDKTALLRVIGGFLRDVKTKNNM